MGKDWHLQPPAAPLGPSKAQSTRSAGARTKSSTVLGPNQFFASGAFSILQLALPSAVLLFLVGSYILGCSNRVRTNR